MGICRFTINADGRTPPSRTQGVLHVCIRRFSPFHDFVVACEHTVPSVGVAFSKTFLHNSNESKISYMIVSITRKRVSSPKMVSLLNTSESADQHSDDENVFEGAQSHF